MARCIVCGVDASPGARAAARAAAGLAEALAADLVLAHVATAPRTRGSAPTPEQHDAWRRRATRAAEDLLADIADDVDAPPATECLCLFGDPARRLAELARGRGALAIVLGARGRGEVHRASFGGVPAEVAAQADRPVLVVPEGGETGLASLGREPLGDPLPAGR